MKTNNLSELSVQIQGLFTKARRFLSQQCSR
jgi:hypothetical protein